MGREIVYCEGCGINLRENDFTRGRAREIDGRPFCANCRPSGELPPRKSTSKIPISPAAKKVSSGHNAIPPAQPRRSAPAPAASNPAILWGSIAAIVFVILLALVMSQSSRPPESPGQNVRVPKYEAPPLPRHEPPPPPLPPQKEPPPPVLPRKDPLPKSSDPLVAPDATAKLDTFLAQIRQIIQTDVDQERRVEVLSMLAAAAKNAGARAGEVEAIKTEYLKRMDSPTARAMAWRDWKISSGSDRGAAQLLASHEGRDSVYLTHPLDQNSPAKLERELAIPTGKKTTLSFAVRCHAQGDFELRVVVDGKQVLREIIGPPNSDWKSKSVDLSPWAGKTVALRLENFPNNWNFEHAYWADLAITSE